MPESARSWPTRSAHIDLVPQPGRVLVCVTGELDVSSAGMLRRALLRACSTSPHVCVDVGGCAFIDVVCTGLLITAAKKAERRGGRLQVLNAAPVVRRLFTVLRAAHLLAE